MFRALVIHMTLCSNSIYNMYVPHIQAVYCADNKKKVQMCITLLYVCISSVSPIPTLMFQQQMNTPEYSNFSTLLRVQFITANFCKIIRSFQITEIDF